MTEEQWTQEFAKKLSRKMKAIGIDQRQLARLTGMSEASISNYISAKQTPKVFALTKIAKALQASIFELIPFDR